MDADFAGQLIICRSGNDPLKPAYECGYKCACCDAPLQVSQFGRNRLRDGNGVLLCNTCGFAIAKILDDKLSVIVNPAIRSEGKQQPQHIRDFPLAARRVVESLSFPQLFSSDET